jgi:hypothetical protein
MKIKAPTAALIPTQHLEPQYKMKKFRIYYLDLKNRKCVADVENATMEGAISNFIKIHKFNTITRVVETATNLSNKIAAHFSMTGDKSFDAGYNQAVKDLIKIVMEYES